MEPNSTCLWAMNLLILKSWIFIGNNFENTEKTLLDFIYSKRNNFGICLVVTNNLKDRKFLEPLLKTNLYQQPRNQSTNSVTVFGCLIFSDFLISYTFHWLSLVRRYVCDIVSWPLGREMTLTNVYAERPPGSGGIEPRGRMVMLVPTLLPIAKWPVRAERVVLVMHEPAADLMQQVLQEGWTSVERGDDTTYCLNTDAEVGGDSDCLLAFSISLLSFSNRF